MPSLQPTYEGLKLTKADYFDGMNSRLQPTYEGLKPDITAIMSVWLSGLQPTYEGLKPLSAPATLDP